jgi:hypothetical protein
MCDHLHDSTSRYDAAKKIMTLLLVCRTCGIERVVETFEYEPKPVWTRPGTAPRQLAVLPVESSIPPDMTLAEWRHRKLAA